MGILSVLISAWAVAAQTPISIPFGQPLYYSTPQTYGVAGFGLGIQSSLGIQPFPLGVPSSFGVVTPSGPSSPYSAFVSGDRFALWGVAEVVAALSYANLPLVSRTFAKQQVDGPALREMFSLRTDSPEDYIAVLRDIGVKDSTDILKLTAFLRSLFSNDSADNAFKSAVAAAAAAAAASSSKS